MAYRINRVIVIAYFCMAMRGCDLNPLPQAILPTLTSQQSSSLSVHPQSNQMTDFPQVPFVSVGPQSAQMAYLPQAPFLGFIPNAFMVVQSPIQPETIQSQGTSSLLQPMVCLPQAESVQGGLQNTEQSSKMEVWGGEHCSIHRSDKELMKMLMDAIDNKAQLGTEMLAELIDDAQKHSFIEESYLRVLDAILKLSPTKAFIKYDFLKKAAIEAGNKISHDKHSLALNDYINIAKMFHCSRLKGVEATDCLRTILNLWTIHCQPILNQRPTLTAYDSTILLCFPCKYGIALEATTIDYLNHTISEDFKSLSLSGLKNLFWLYHQTTKLAPRLLELMYATLHSDICSVEKQQDENNVRDVFFILIAGAKLKLEAEKTTAGTTLATSSESQQQRFLNWLKKNKLPVRQVSDSLLSIINTTVNASSHALGDKKKKKSAKVSRKEDNKNDWKILEEAEAKALSELQEAVQFVKHREKESSKVQKLVDKIYELKVANKPYDQLLDRVIKEGSVEGLLIRGDYLVDIGDLETAIPYYYTAHQHRHPEAAYHCAIACQKKAQSIVETQPNAAEAKIWYRKSLSFYRDAITLYLTDAKIETKIDQTFSEYLYNFLYNAALVATELDEIRLSAFCLYGVLELRKEVESDIVKRKLATYQANKAKESIQAKQKQEKEHVAEKIKRASIQEVEEDIQYLVNKLYKRYYPEE